MKTLSLRNSVLRAAQQWRKGELPEKAFIAVIDEYTSNRKPSLRCSCPRGRCQRADKIINVICKRPELAALTARAPTE